MRHSLQRDDTVMVYGGKAFDPETRDMPVAKCKATRDAIAATCLAEHVPGTGEPAPRQALDAQGRYRRLATGWGALA